MGMTNTAAESITLPLVRALESTWNAIRKNHRDVPAVMVSVGSGTEGRKGTVKYGHFASARWVHAADGTQYSELFVGGEGLQHGALHVLGTLLHEAAHGAAFARDVQDTSRGGRYHNKTFKMIGEEFGLTITENKELKIGWSDTAVPEATQKRYARQLAALEKAMVIFRLGESQGDRKGTTRKSNNNGVTAECGCGRKLRMSKTAWEAGSVICGTCMKPFEADEVEGEDDE